jgi:hypothetical protein
MSYVDQFMRINYESIFNLYVYIMNCNQLYICIATVLIIYYIFSTYITENFVYDNNNTYGRFPFLFNIVSHNKPIYQDIRGSPNAAYIMDLYGTITHIGYKFGPYLYDAQGNRIKYRNNSYYVS